MKLPDVIDQAETLYARGCKLFRLQRGTKSHFIDTDWSDKPFTSFVDLFFAGLDDTCNIAVNVGASDLVVIDVDNGEGKHGSATLAAIGGLPPTFTVRTPNGGFHYYFKTGGRNFTQRGLAPNVDVRAGKGYVIAPGSIGANGKPYEVVDGAAFADLPEWLLERLTPRDERPASKSTMSGVDELRAAARAIDYLDAMPPVRSGERNSKCLNAANRIMDFGVSAETAAHLMQTAFKAIPPLDENEAAGIVERAAATRRNPIGIDAPEVGFEPLAAELIAEPEAPAAPAKPRKLVEFASEIDLAQIIANKERALVRDLIHRGDTAVLYGDSGAGKSFCALDLGWHIARGERWLGRVVRRAPVLYVALEGIEGFRQRMTAIKSERGDAGQWFARLSVSVALIQSEAGAEGVKTTAEACAYLAAEVGEPVGLIVIDTLSQAIAGMDENATDVMSAFIRERMGAISKLTGACVMAVHHTNKAGQIRGSSTLYAASDVVLRADCEKDEKGNKVGERRQLSAQKVKDGVEGLLCYYKLKTIPLGEYQDGAEITSAVIELDNTGDIDEAVLRALETHWPALSQGRFSPSPRSPGTSAAKLLCEREGDQFLSPAEVQRALERLEKRGLICREQFAPAGSNQKSERWAPAF